MTANNEAVGAFLRNRRETYQLSQQAVAQLTTLKHQIVLSRVEDGSRPLRFHEAVQLAKVLDFTLDELAGALPGAGPTVPGMWARAESALAWLRKNHEDGGVA
jgi:transcriptional regulator with XRE-family HTH domain